MEVKKEINQGTLIYGGILMLACLLVVLSQPVNHSSAKSDTPVDLTSKQFLLHKATKLTIDNNGQKIAHISRAATIAQALAEIDITLPSGTISFPDRSTQLDGTPTRISILDSTIPIKIIDQNRSYSIQTRAATVSDILASCNIRLNSKDRVYPNLDKKIASGGTIVIDRALPVTVTFGEKKYELQTQAKTKAELLAQAKEELNITEELVNNNPEEEIHSGEEISLSSTYYKEVSEDQIIPFETIYIDNYDMFVGEETVLESGQNGTKTITYRIKYENENEISREIINEQTVSESKPTRIARGQKTPEPEPIYYPAPTGVGQVGTASWYYYGSTPTCAHRTYPKGTNLLVTNNSTGASVVVVVNDYGPAEWTGRIIDLNSVAFSAIAPLGQGLAEVTVSPI